MSGARVCCSNRAIAVKYRSRRWGLDDLAHGTVKGTFHAGGWPARQWEQLIDAQHETQARVLCVPSESGALD